MARRRRSLIGGARTKGTRRVSTDAPAEARSEQPQAPEPVDVQASSASVDESTEPPEHEPKAETAGRTIVPDMDDIDDLMDEAEAASNSYGNGETFDVIGVSDDTPAPIEHAPDDLIQEPPPAPSAPEEMVSFEEAPTQQDASEWASDVEVGDAQYVETGKFAEDSTDHGWQDSLYGGPATISPEMNDIDDFPESAASDPLGSGFIDMSDGARPPTEEAPGAVMEDLSQVYSAPMSVPEPPPVPGIVDRYTPPPMTRRGPNPPTGVDSRRPAFTPSPAPRTTPARPVTATPAPDLRRRPTTQKPQGSGPTVPLFAAFVLGALVLLLMIALFWTLVNMQQMASSTDDVPVQAVPASSEPAQPAPAGLPMDDPQVAPSEVPVREGIGAQPVPEPVVAEPEPEPAPAPVAAPAPRPAPAPEAAPDRPVATNGTLSVESNRRVIVSINGTPYEFTPLEVAVPAGQYTISAALPSRADSEQTQQVDLEAGDRKSLYFRF